MDQISRQFRAMQAAATASVLTAAVLALPLLAAENSTDFVGNVDSQNIINLFQKTGAETVSSFDSRSIDSSGFDFAAFISNTCFRPTEFDLASCKEKFGRYADLKATYNSGELYKILSSVSYLAGSAKFAPAPAKLAEKAKTVSETVKFTRSNDVIYVTDNEREIRERSVKLWRICQTKEFSRADEVSCYQRNINRTALGEERPAEENVF